MIALRVIAPDWYSQDTAQKAPVPPTERLQQNTYISSADSNRSQYANNTPRPIYEGERFRRGNKIVPIWRAAPAAFHKPSGLGEEVPPLAALSAALHYDIPVSYEASPLTAVSDDLRRILRRDVETPRDEYQEQDMSALLTPVKIIGYLTGAIAAMLPVGGILIGIIYGNLKSDIDDIKKSNQELIKTVSSVDKQVAVSNQRLDDIVRELQKRR